LHLIELLKIITITVTEIELDLAYGVEM